MNFSESLKQFQRKPQKVQLVGYPANPRFHALQEQTQFLLDQSKGRYQFEITNLHESDYDKRVKTLKRKDPHFSSQFKLRSLNSIDQAGSTGSIDKSSWLKRPPFLMVNDSPVFSIDELKQIKVPLYRQEQLRTRHTNRAQSQLLNMFSEDEHKAYVFIEFEYETSTIFTILELYKSILPKTCRNFIELLTGTTIDGHDYSYKDTVISRIMKNGFLQGGNVDGRGGRSIYGRYFNDESFVIKHDEPGMIGMANIDQPHTNASQFYITLAPLNGFDGHKVAFGKVVAGLKGLQHYVKQHNTQSPTLRIANCGVYNPKEILRKETTSNGIKQLPKADQAVEFDSRVPESTSPRKPNLKRNFLEQLYIANKIKEFGPDSVTLTTFLIQEQQKIKEATGDFTAVVDALQNAFRKVNNLLQFSGIGQRLAIVKQAAIDIVVSELRINKKCALLYCLDQGLTIIIPEQERGKYIVVFRALDLESEDATYENNTPVASMFLIMKKQTTKFKPVLEKDLYQSGETVIGGGYCLYSQSTQLVVSIGFNTNIFTFDSCIGEFILSNPRILIPQKLGIYSVDESAKARFDDKTKTFLEKYKLQVPYTSMRYSGSLYTNVHRTLLYGGICLYPQPTVSIFEALLIAIMLEKCWGLAYTTKTSRSSLIKITELQERTPLFFGVPGSIQLIENLYLSIHKD